MLLPPEIFWYVSVPFRLSERFKMLPFTWDPERQRVRAAQSKQHLVITGVWFIAALVLELELIFFSHQTWDTVSETVQMINFMTAFNVGTFVQYIACILVVQSQVPQLFNSVLDYAEKFERKYTKRRCQEPKTTRMLRLLLPTGFYGFIGILVYTGLHLMYRPDVVVFPDTSPVWQKLGLEPIKVRGVNLDRYLLTIILYMFLASGVAFAVVFFWSMVLLLAIVVDEILHEMRQTEEGSQSFWTREGLRHPGGFCKTTRQVYLLATLLGDVASPMMLVLPTNAVVVMVLMAFHAMKAEHLYLRLGCGIAFFLLLNMFAMINRFGGNIPKHFRTNGRKFLDKTRDIWAAKTIDAVRIPAFHVYGLYTIEDELTIGGLQTVFDNVISLLAV